MAQQAMRNVLALSSVHWRNGPLWNDAIRAFSVFQMNATTKLSFDLLSDSVGAQRSRRRVHDFVCQTFGNSLVIFEGSFSCT